MYDLKSFQERVRELYRRATPYPGERRPTQADLAEAIGLSRAELSRRLSGRNDVHLSPDNVRAIVRTLAEWEAIQTQAEAMELLALVNCPPFTAAEWHAPPLDRLAPVAAQPQASKPTMTSVRQSSPPLRGNLPTLLTSFVGRERELDEVAHLLARTRLLTVVGVGGCGKTRLTVETAARLQPRFSDGVWLVELAALNDPALLPQTVAQVLGCVEQSRQPMLDLLTDFLQNKQLLLVMDNCEHLIAGVAALAHQLLRVAPQLHILATSRERLRIEGEINYPLPPLSLPLSDVSDSLHDLSQYEAIRLFAERAVAADPHFSLTAANVPTVRIICQQLDGIPLAIELAVARLGNMTLPQLHNRLKDRFRLLTSGSRAALPRQQTLRALVDWSYDLLSRSEGELFRWLAVFTGSFTLEAVSAVCSNEDDDTLDLLASLVDKSMIRKFEADDGVARYTMLETIRQYALERLQESGELAAIQQRHAGYYMILAERAAPELKGSNQVAWFRYLDEEHDNLRAALGWSLAGGNAAEVGARIAVAIHWFWITHSHFSEGRHWLRAATASSELAPTLRAEVLLAAGRVVGRLWEYAEAKALYDEALHILEGLDDQVGVAQALHSVGNLLLSSGDQVGARPYYVRSLDIRRQIGDQRGIASTLANLGAAALSEGDYATAVPLYQESVDIYRQLGDQYQVAVALGNLGVAASEQGDLERARQLLTESLAVGRQVGDDSLTASTLLNLASSEYEARQYELARIYASEGLSFYHRMGDKLRIANALNICASICVAADNARLAVQICSMVSRLQTEKHNLQSSIVEQRYQQTLAVAREQLGEQGFTTAWQIGQQMLLEQLIAQILKQMA